MNIAVVEYRCPDTIQRRSHRKAELFVFGAGKTTGAFVLCLSEPCAEFTRLISGSHIRLGTHNGCAGCFQNAVPSIRGCRWNTEITRTSDGHKDFNNYKGENPHTYQKQEFCLRRCATAKLLYTYIMELGLCSGSSQRIQAASRPLLRGWGGLEGAPA